MPVTGSFTCQYCIIQFTFDIDSSFMLFYFLSLTYLCSPVVHPLRRTDFFSYLAPYKSLNCVRGLCGIYVFHVYISLCACFMCPLS